MARSLHPSQPSSLGLNMGNLALYIRFRAYKVRVYLGSGGLGRHTYNHCRPYIFSEFMLILPLAKSHDPLAFMSIWGHAVFVGQPDPYELVQSTVKPGACNGWCHCLVVRRGHIPREATIRRLMKSVGRAARAQCGMSVVIERGITYQSADGSFEKRHGYSSEASRVKESYGIPKANSHHPGP